MFSRSLWSLLILCGILFAVTSPIWHGPDEQVHFAQTAYYAEKGHFQIGYEADVTYEIYESTKLLETLRDKQGNNAFTFRPWYRIEYSDSFRGVYESDIEALKTDPKRAVMVGTDATHYPPLYYKITGTVYKWLYNQSVLERLWGARWVSVALSFITLYVVYLIGKNIFQEQQRWLTLTAMVGLAPMWRFVSSSVNSDALFNLTATAIIYGGVRLVKDGWNWRVIGLNGLVLYVAYLTKPQWVILAGLLGLASLIWALKKWWQVKKHWFLIGGATLLLIGIVSINRINWVAVAPEIDRLNNAPDYGWWDHVKYVAFHTYREVLPWYWGVFNWLGVTLPRWINRVQMGILLLTVIGWVWLLIQGVWKKSWTALGKYLSETVFVVLAGIAYFVALETWEFLFIKSSGYAYGIQGRYFFPTIVSHMATIMVGISVWTKSPKVSAQLLMGWWLVLFWVGWWTLARSYYELGSLQSFILQASQYKPWYLKGYVFWIALVGISGGLSVRLAWYLSLDLFKTVKSLRSFLRSDDLSVNKVKGKPKRTAIHK